MAEALSQSLRNLLRAGNGNWGAIEELNKTSQSLRNLLRAGNKEVLTHN